MANDIGLPDEGNTSTVDTILNIDEQNDSTHSENIELEEDEDPAENITKHNLTNSPWSKLGVVGFFFGTGFLMVFLVFSGVLNRNSSAKNEEIPSQIPEETLARIENNNGDIFAQAALGKQETELQKINQKPTPEESENSKEATPEPITQPEPTTPPNPSPPPAPAPVNRSAQREVSPTVRPLPPPTPTSQPRNVSVPPAPLPSTAPAPDPIAELNRLRNVGSFGNIAYANNSTPTATIPQRTVTRDNSGLARLDRNFVSPTGGNRQNTRNIASTRIERIEPRWQANQRNLQTSGDVADFRIASVNYLPQEAQILNERRNRYLVVGEFASGELITPLVKEQATDRNQQSEDGKRYVARLTEDLKDNEGNVAIASGSLMALEMLSVDGASYAQVQVTSIIKDNTEFPISAGAITVQGDGGRPLIAQQYKDKGTEIAQYDLTFGLVSGLGKIGEIINQPDIQDEVEDELLDGTIRRRTRVNNSRRNIGGAVLEGAFGSLSDIIGRRAETSTREILTRPNVWYIPSNTKITFLVNRTLELP
ncbi:TrbI/VirB10 family protein [Nodularia sp. NIES-3585]|uniref:TrbI/VirB10 family protein n=1 Tax=Nodularia sp. NIES-3585 TaxID=1973477 RepID=UPI000B5CD15E|nr:TrbI/VirB10 family protein [Nodularia sp. NIES-3585]GAX38810.1 hypothetical protein NIES3585_48620 [Nodularia sp. NIES-3585]